MGAVSLLGGIQRSPISLCVVILEGTGQGKYLLPIILITILSILRGGSPATRVLQVGRTTTTRPLTCNCRAPALLRVHPAAVGSLLVGSLTSRPVSRRAMGGWTVATQRCDETGPRL